MKNNLDYVEDMNNFSKRKELTVLTSGGLLIFDPKGRLTFLPLNVNLKDNSLEIILSLKDVNNIPGV